MPTFTTGKSAVFKIDDTSGTERTISDVLNSVDFPAPFLPIMPSRSPGATSRLIFSKTVCSAVLPSPRMA